MTPGQVVAYAPDLGDVANDASIGSGWRYDSRFPGKRVVSRKIGGAV